MTFEEAYDRGDFRAAVTRTCWSRRKLYALPELDVEEMVAEAWVRIWRYWPAVAGGRNPVGLAVRHARLACSELRTRRVGRMVRMRGKLTLTKGWRDDGSYDQTSAGFREYSPDEVLRMRTIRRSRWLTAFEVAVIHESCGNCCSAFTSVCPAGVAGGCIWADSSCLAAS